MKEEAIAKYFFKCGVSDVLDGTEDGILLEDRDSSDSVCGVC